MEIVKKIKALSAKIEADPALMTGKAKELQDKAVKAIFAGRLDKDNKVTAEWEAYMKVLISDDAGNFVPEELAKLKGPDGPLEESQGEYKQALAYIVANAVCATGTTTKTTSGLTPSQETELDAA